FLQEIELRALLAVGHLATAIQGVNWGSLSLEHGALIDTGKEARPPILRVALGQSAAERVIHGHKCRQVLAGRAGAVSNPGAEAREAHARHARVDLEQGR